MPAQANNDNNDNDDDYSNDDYNDDYDDSNDDDDDDAGKGERDKDHYSTYDGRATHIRWENISRGKYKAEEKIILAVQKKGDVL